ncbi:MAG: pyridoxamine 5'-phosphate oxidase family protein [Candidatus Omnitrophica bacterium]|nr:pyridoxamine 5'-phosphate oxidase family protein [Candidatus Omnitrophota bacterium]MDD5352954.1 pyridoxamine 5'-phosphate oxidase family protein [Candidatus Omnitrophota bacterium]MDD5550553.1 pyridoxamine 5'-phosphate oxidase family protein [Candidatus Omnitrophota bacterium]
MAKLTQKIVNFFQNQSFVIVSTIDKNGTPHNSCKGIVRLEPDGRVYLLDVYKARTSQNLKRSPRISITAVDEHKFIGYCLKGKAELIGKDRIKPDLLKAWEDRITSRITQRVLKNVRGEKGHSRHPEILLPRPQYLISLKVEEIVNLTPRRLK